MNINFKANGSTSKVIVSPNVDTKDTKVSVEFSSLDKKDEKISYDLIFDGDSFSYNLPTPKVGFYKATISFSKLNPTTNVYELSDI